MDCRSLGESSDTRIFITMFTKIYKCHQLNVKDMGAAKGTTTKSARTSDIQITNHNEYLVIKLLILKIGSNLGHNDPMTHFLSILLKIRHDLNTNVWCSVDFLLYMFYEVFYYINNLIIQLSIPSCAHEVI